MNKKPFYNITQHIFYEKSIARPGLWIFINALLLLLLFFRVIFSSNKHKRSGMIDENILKML